jgi:hypothetical protein
MRKNNILNYVVPAISYLLLFSAWLVVLLSFISVSFDLYFSKEILTWFEKTIGNSLNFAAVTSVVLLGLAGSIAYILIITERRRVR